MNNGLTDNEMLKNETAEREGIISNREKRNIIISAGAGAGKTEMLSRSILTRLFNDPSLQPSEIVVITFTNAATEELKSRLYKVYASFSAEAKKNNTTVRRINIDDIFVSTIHSFCSSLVTQMAFECELGISPEFEESTDLSDSREVEVFIRNYIREHREYDILKKYFTYSAYTGIKKSFLDIAENPELDIIIESDAAEPDSEIKKCLDPIRSNLGLIESVVSGSELAQKLSEAVAEGNDTKNTISVVYELTRKYYTPRAKELSSRIYKIVHEAYCLLKQNGIDKDSIKEREEECVDLIEPTVEKLLKLSRESINPRLEEFIKKDYEKLLTAAEKLSEVMNEKKGRLTKLKTLINTNIIKTCEDNAQNDDDGSCVYTNTRAIDRSYEPTEDDEDFFVRLSDIFDKLSYKDINAYKKESEEYYSRLKAEYVKGMYEEYVKLERTAINSNDLLVLSKKLLYGKREKAVRAYFRSKYKVFYVDEFQDTDYLQLKMILALTGDDENGGLSEGRLFLVGDPKQSIYRFRGAEVAFYNYMKDECFKKDDFHDLRINYRSDSSVVDWVNRTYRKKFENGSISYSDMIPFKNCSGKTADPDDKSVNDSEQPKLLPLADDNGRLPLGVFEETYPLVTADVVADRAESLLGKSMIVYDKKKGENVEHIVRPEDIMIITKRKNDATDIYNALKLRNIPVTVSGKISPAEKRAMCRLQALMRYIESGTRLRTAEVVAAFSPLSGLFPSDNTVHRGVVTDSYTAEQAQRLFDILSSSEKLYYSGGAMAVIYNALNKGYFLDGCLNDITLNDELPLLYQFIETMSVQCCDNIGAINEYIADFMEKELKNVLSQSKTKRCVRVMNLHQTKGLESKIVINAMHDPGERGESTYFEYCRKKEDSDKLEVYDVPKCYMLLSEQKQKEKKRLREEEQLRKEYVRDTRAEYIMLFMNKTDSQETDAPDAERAVTETDEAEKAAVSRIPAAVYTAAPCDKALSSFDRCYLSASPSALEIGRERDDPDAAGETDKEELRGAVRGTIMHRAFELYLLNRRLSRDITDKQLEFFARQAVIESMDKLSDADEGQKEAQAYYESILSDLRYFREKLEESPYADCEFAVETPFFMVIDSMHNNDGIRSLIEQNRKEKMTAAPKDTPAERIILRGFSDLICIDAKGRFTIIDYKSDEAGYLEKTMLDIYRPQQCAYYLAFSSLLKQYEPGAREMHLYAPHAFRNDPFINGSL